MQPPLACPAHTSQSSQAGLIMLSKGLRVQGHHCPHLVSSQERALPPPALGHDDEWRTADPWPRVRGHQYVPTAKQHPWGSGPETNRPLFGTLVPLRGGERGQGPSKAALLSKQKKVWPRLRHQHPQKPERNTELVPTHPL